MTFILALAAIWGTFQIKTGAAPAPELSLKTRVLRISLSSAPLGYIVYDREGKTVLATAAGDSVYFSAADGKRAYLKNCVKKSADGKAVALECSAGGKKASVKLGIENDYEVSLEIKAGTHVPGRRIGQRFRLPAGESVYGLKEHVEGDGKSGTDAGDVQRFATLDQRGSTVDMYTRPTISIYSPFHINSRGYGLFFDTSWPGTYDIGDSDPHLMDIGFEGPALKMYFTYGPGAPEIIERHTARVGRSVLPPAWTAQVFKWRDEHVNLPMIYDNTPNKSPFNSQVYEDVTMLEKLGIPTGVYWLDRPWAKGPFGYDDFEFDTMRFPKPGEMVKWLKEKHGMEMLLWVAPWIYGEMRKEAEKKGYIAPNSDKVIDLTNPEAVVWWQNAFKKVFDLGVAGFKLDRSEEVVPSTELDVYDDGRTGREIHNIYPMLYAKAVKGACEKFRGDDCIVMPRAGFTGSQKYAVFWGGDTHASWRGLRSAVISCERAGMMGFPVWGSDTGGYGKPESRDLFSRWLQVSAFHPIMEVGGSGSHEPWNAAYEPKYDEIGINNYRFYAKLHTELAPYNYSYMHGAHTTGRPIVRPLFYAWPDDVRVRDMWDEFMMGDWLLTAPVLTEGAVSREVYLPEGRWFDFWDMGAEYDGSKNYLVSAPIERTPIFIRGGAIIPLEIIDDETGWGAKFAKGVFAIAFFPAGGASSFILYRDGKASAIKMSDEPAKVVLDTSQVSSPALVRVRTAAPSRVTLDGKQIERFVSRKPEEFAAAGSAWTYDSANSTLWIKTPANGIFVIEK